jgi:hypothetical protein
MPVGVSVVAVDEGAGEEIAGSVTFAIGYF